MHTPEAAPSPSLLRRGLGVARRAVGPLRRGLGVLASLMDRLVADRRKPPRMPLGNFIPNSNGEGGRVISSGDSGGNG